MNSVQKQSNYLKLLYFFLFIGFGGGLPFVGIFYKHVIVNADGTPAIDLISLIFFATPIVGFLANLGAGIIADKFCIGRHIMTLCCFGTAVTALFVGFVGEPWAQALSLQSKFILIFIFLIILSGCNAPLNPIIDAETMLFLNAHQKRELYGSYRIWGTYGWSVSTIAIGVVLFFWKNLSLLFYAAAVEFIFLCFLSYKGTSHHHRSEPVTIPWHHLRKDHHFQIFLLFSFIYGIIANASANYTTYFFDDVMKTPLEICFIYGAWTIFEIPVMFYGYKLLGRFDNRYLIVVGLLLNAVRLFLFSLFTMDVSFWFKFSIALMQGPAFALMQIGFIDFVDRQAHQSLRATYMSLMNVVRVSISSAFGGILGGWVIKQWSGAFLMEWSGILSLACTLFFLYGVKNSVPQIEAIPATNEIH
jgi:PPP family 3-phenylpropionic acid transporter